MKLELKDLRHVYPTGDEALRGISTVIEGTEPVAIIGQNGSGKTTLVKHFNGILRPTAGDVLLDGESISKRTTAQWSRDVGYVFQNPDDQLFLNTVRKELEFGPRQLGFPEDRISSLVAFAADLCALTEKLEEHPFDLTATEKKFCTVAAILTMNPQVLIFDEPTCGQDVEGTERLSKIIRTMEERGKLCITISHDMKFVVNHFKRSIVLCKGQILLDGPTKEVFSETEKLAQSFVSPPPVARVAQKTLGETVFTTDAFINLIRAFPHHNIMA